MPALGECLTAVEKLARKRNIHDIGPSFGARFKIYSVDTSGRHGKIINRAVEEIGEMLVCQNRETYPEEMNFTPMYYEITIGNRTFRIAGGGTSSDYPEFPALPGGGSRFTPPDSLIVPGGSRGVYIFSGTVMPGGSDLLVGAYMESALFGSSGAFDDG